MLPIQPSDVRTAPPPPLSVSLQGKGGPHPPPSSVRAHDPLISSLLPQQVEPTLQPSTINPPHLPQCLALPLKQHVPSLQPLYARAPPPPLSVSIQGRGKPPLLNLTVRACVPLLYALLLWQGMPLIHLSAKPAPLPLLSAFLPQQDVPLLQPLAMRTPLTQILALPLQQGMPHIQIISVRAPPPPTLSVLLQGPGVPPCYNFNRAIL